MRLGRPIATAIRHVPRWALVPLLLAAVVLIATRTRRSPQPPLAPAGPTTVVDTSPPAEPEPSATSEPAPGPVVPPEPAEPAVEPRDGRTRQELYAEAQRLGIPGRSKMRRDELARAIAEWPG